MKKYIYILDAKTPITESLKNENRLLTIGWWTGIRKLKLHFRFNFILFWQKNKIEIYYYFKLLEIYCT